MKLRMMIRLAVNLILIVAFVIGATIVASNYRMDPNGWLDSQMRTHLLWIVDGLAALALFFAMTGLLAKAHLVRARQEFSRSQEEHQKQLDRMIQNTEQMEMMNSEQANQIAELEEGSARLLARMDALDAEMRAKLEKIEADAIASQSALAIEARQLADMAFAQLHEQVDLTTRQMEAVNLAMQYQRAEIRQLRQSLRGVQQNQEFTEIAELSNDDLDHLNSEEATRLLNVTHHTSTSDPNFSDPPIFPSAASDGETPHVVATDGEFTIPPTDARLFTPTMNAETTFVSPQTAFAIASPYLDALNEMNEMNESEFDDIDTNNIEITNIEVDGTNDTDSTDVKPEAQLPNNATSDVRPTTSWKMRY